MAMIPDFVHEAAARARGLAHVAGVDEAGRGPLAGPVVAAAVILNPADIPEGLRDSKTLSAPARAALAREITARARTSIAEASTDEIAALNILHASLLAMRRAVEGLASDLAPPDLAPPDLAPPDLALIDGNRVPPGLPCPAEALVKGDARCLSIAAASILAKTARDAIMTRLAAEHPGYGWERNAGYPTAEHLDALRRLGVTPHHRQGFAPIRKILCEESRITR